MITMYNSIENITICDHPLIKHKLTMIRNKETGTNEFRSIMEELAIFLWKILKLKLRSKLPNVRFLPERNR